MKITKSQLKQIIKEEIEVNDELIDAIENLSDKIDGLDVSIDFLAAAFVGGDPRSIGQAQKQIGRAYSPPPKKYSKVIDEDLMKIVREELEVVLTNEEAADMFGEEILEQLEEEVVSEAGGVVGNFGGLAGGLGASAGRGGDEPDSPDQSVYGPEQTAEDNFVGILNDLGHMLDEWEKKEYPSDEMRYKSYFEDLQILLEQYDPCAHRGQKCDEAHPGQSHEECIEVTINNALYEVYSKRQRGWACAQERQPAKERKKGLSKKEASEMCRGPMKKKKRGKK